MISESIWVRLVCPTEPTMHGSAISRERAETWLSEYKPGPRHPPFEIVTVPHCFCCGRPAQPKATRCQAHQGRDACAIEGCKKTRDSGAGERVSNHAWICHVHWKQYVPPGSRTRRAYLALLRRARKNRSPQCPSGWDATLTARYWKFWEVLLRQVRRRATEGFIDEAEINRIMGWSEPER